MKPDMVVGNHAIIGSNSGPAVGSGERVIVNLRADFDILDALEPIDRAIVNFGRYKMCATDYFCELSKDSQTRDDMLTLVDHVRLGSDRQKALALRQAQRAISLMRRWTRLRRPRPR